MIHGNAVGDSVVALACRILHETALPSEYQYSSSLFGLLICRFLFFIFIFFSFLPGEDMGWMWIFLDKCSMGSVGITFISPKIIESETRFIKLELKKKKKKFKVLFIYFI